MSLSEKRQHIYRKFITGKPVKQKDTLNLLFEIIEEQDKEFIKELKEEVEKQNFNSMKKVPSLTYIKNIIDKLAGDKLI